MSISLIMLGSSRCRQNHRWGLVKSVCSLVSDGFLLAPEEKFEEKAVRALADKSS